MSLSFIKVKLDLWKCENGNKHLKSKSTTKDYLRNLLYKKHNNKNYLKCFNLLILEGCVGVFDISSNPIKYLINMDCFSIL